MKKISELGDYRGKALIEGIAFLLLGVDPNLRINFPELMLRLFLTFLWARGIRGNFLFRWFSKAGRQKIHYG